MSLFKELQRRNVIRVAMAYVVASWLIIQVVETIFPVYGLGDFAIRTVITVLAVAFIPTLIFSWAFEITPEGLKREVEVVRDHTITRLTGRKLDRIIMLLLALAIAYFALDKFVLEPVRVEGIVEETAQQARSQALVESYGDQSIAVLPFVNMSADPEQEYFSDGISEEILNLLARIPELRVISRSSAFSFKGKDIAIPEVARQLNVGHVLEGSVRKAGDRVRITVQLIEARSDTHLWAETFERELGDIFEVQEEIAGVIGQELKMKLAPETAGSAQPGVIRPASADVYDIYLKGRELVHTRADVNLEEAVRLFERALRLDADFAPAHAQLAIATLHLTQYGGSALEDAKRTAVEHLDRAQALERNLAEAHAGRALLASHLDDPESAIVHAEKALAVNPSYTDAMLWRAGALNRLGLYAEADAAYEQVLLTDPLNIVGLLNYIERLNDTGRTGEALELADVLVEQDPGAGYHAHQHTALVYEGKIAEGLYWALLWGREAGRGSGYAASAFMFLGEFEEARRFDSANIWVDVAQGRWDEAIQASQRSLQVDPDNPSSLATAGNVLFGAGRIEEALPLLEQALDIGAEGRPVAAFLDHYHTMLLAMARRYTGDEDGAQYAAGLVRQDHAARVAAGRKNANEDIAGALVAAFDHNVEGAIDLLESAVQRGLRDRGVFTELAFENLWNEPRFLALGEELNGILAEERRKVLQLICLNNPVPDDWRPLSETCDGVADADRPN